jgi:hypothetical protein
LAAAPASPLVTTFQPERPPEMSSSEARRRAMLNGSLQEVVMVATRPRRVVLTARADSSVSGSSRLR